MKRTPLKRISAKKLAERVSKKDESESLWNWLFSMYKLIPETGKRCESCGKKLSIIPRTYYFDHLIEKSKRPDLAMEAENIFLCCLECHSLKTNGHPTEKHQEAIRKAKERFGISQKE